MRIKFFAEVPVHTMSYVCSGHSGRPQEQILEFLECTVDGLPEGVNALVVAADLQGRERVGGRLLGQTVAEELVLLVDGGVIPSPSGILLAGDLYDRPDCGKRGGSGDVAPVWKEFAKHFSIVMGVHGNHDYLDARDLPLNASVLDAEIQEWEGLKIGGLCGIMGKPTKNQRRGSGDYLKLLEGVLRSNPDIMLTHCGPDDPETGRIGEPTVRMAMERFGTGLVIFGHCFWQDPIAEIGGSQVLNVDGRVIILKRGDE
ncbi:metallophosphoesterase family protein [Haloferula sp.]|uniref:metallophosphoesterase family protein n=1 Tax=Haloferula sp. TaxID=2497595 RepID=UPI003C754FA1